MHLNIFNSESVKIKKKYKIYKEMLKDFRKNYNNKKQFLILISMFAKI